MALPWHCGRCVCLKTLEWHYHGTICDACAVRLMSSVLEGNLCVDRAQWNETEKTRHE